MSNHTPAPELVTGHPEQIPGYTYGTDEAATSPLRGDGADRRIVVIDIPRCGPVLHAAPG